MVFSAELVENTPPKETFLAHRLSARDKLPY
jgi:hypothetical protein